MRDKIQSIAFEYWFNTNTIDSYQKSRGHLINNRDKQNAILAVSRFFMSYLWIRESMVEEVGSFTDLTMIIGCLHKNEIRLVRKSIVNNKDDDKLNNYQKLFEYIVKHQNADELKAQIYLRETKQAFLKTTQRLLEKLDYILASNENLIGNSAYSLKIQNLFLTSNALIASAIYRGKGVQRRAHKIVDDAIHRAKASEEYGMLIELLHLKFRWLMLSGQKNKADNYLEQIKHFEICRTALFESTNLFYEIGELTNKFSTRQKKDKLIEKIKIISDHAENTKSLQISFFSHMLNFNIAIELNQPKEAEQIANSFYKLVNQNDLLRRRPNIGIANLFLSAAYQAQRNYELSLEFSKIAKEYFRPNSYNYFHIEELEFYNLFLLGRYNEAEEKILSVINNSFYTKSNFLENKKEYLLACVYFAQEKYHDAIRLLNTITEIPKDKTGWNFGIKNLTIMITIINGDYDSTMRLVESYERDIKRIKRVQSIRKRDLTIVKLFKKYVQFGDAQQAIKSLGNEFLLLFSSEDEYVQIIPGHELISISKWFSNLKKDNRFLKKGPFTGDFTHKNK